MLHRRNYLHAFILLFHSVAASAAEVVTYEADVKPILREHCFACHSQDDASSDLALDSFESLLTGGASGEVVAAGDADGSRLWKLITHQEEPKMPPGDKLPEANLQTIKAWIAGGLLKDAGSKPLESNKPAVATIDASQLGKPVGEPAMPEQLFHQPVLWSPRVGPVEAIATSPWAPLAAVAWQRQVSLYDTNTRELLGIVPYVDGVPRVVKFSRDGSLLLVAGGLPAAAGSAALFDVKTGARLATLGDELDMVLAADVSPDLSLVAIGGPKKKVRVYRVVDGSLAYEIKKHTDWVTALAFSPDGQLLATADRNGGALIWQAGAGHERADLRGHKAAVTSVDWRADSAMIATASEDGTTRLWNPAGQQIKSIETHKPGVLSVRFAGDGSFVTAGRDRHVKTWKPDGGAIADLGQMPGIALAATFTHDGGRVIASDYTGEVRVIDAESKATVGQLDAAPKFIDGRLADAETSQRDAEQEFQTAEQLQADGLAKLENAKAAHAAHQTKLAETQAALESEKKVLAQTAAQREQREQQVAEKQQVVDRATALLAEKNELLAQLQVTPTEDSDGDSEADEKAEEDPNAERVAELQAEIAASEAALQNATQAVSQSESELAATTAEHTTAEASVKDAEALLKKVQDETAALPDVSKLTQELETSKSKAEAAKGALAAAKRSSEKIAEQQARFAKAAESFAEQSQARQSEQQVLAKQTGKLEAQHEQAAQQLSDHRDQVTKLAEQLETLQAKLAELQTDETTLKQAEEQLAGELATVQTSLTKTQQAIARLENSKHDFDKAAKLREKYSAQQNTTAGEE